MPLGGWASAAFCWHHFAALKALTRQSSAPDGAGISARLLGRNQGCGWTARNAAWIDADFCGVLVSRSCAGGASVARSGAERAHRQHRACRYACAIVGRQSRRVRLLCYAGRGLNVDTVRREHQQHQTPNTSWQESLFLVANGSAYDDKQIRMHVLRDAT